MGVDVRAQFRRASDALVSPRGPRPGRVPPMLGGHAPRTTTAAATHADTWSASATTSSLPEALRASTEQQDRICDGSGARVKWSGRAPGAVTSVRYGRPGSGRVGAGSAASPRVFQEPARGASPSVGEAWRLSGEPRETLGPLRHRPTSLPWHSATQRCSRRGRLGARRASAPWTGPRARSI
jgi:hypothetical protein